MHTHINIVVPSMMANKVAVIKAIRMLTGLGLKEAKDVSDQSGEHTLTLSSEYNNNWGDPAVINQRLEEQCRTLRQNGVKVGSPVFVVLDDLRKLGAQALEMGEDELANEILQLVLAEKLRRTEL